VDEIMIGDICSVFFEVARDVSKLNITVQGTQVTSYKVAEQQIQKLNNDVLMEGDGGIHWYDVGIEIGTKGISKDDIRETTFTVFGVTTNDFTPAEEFGIRLTSVGSGTNRGESSKMYGQRVCCAFELPV